MSPNGYFLPSEEQIVIDEAEEIVTHQKSAPLTVLVNAVSSVFGGGITVAIHLTEAMARLRPHHRFVLYCANMQVAKHRYPANVEVHFLPELVSRRKRWLWEQFALPGLAQMARIDLILCLGGYAIFRSPIPQISVWQNLSVFSPSPIARPLREKIYIEVQRQIQAWSMRKAQQNIFLTQSSIDAANQWWNMQNYQHTYVHSGIDCQDTLVSELPNLETREPLVLTIGHAYFHKNYEVLIDAMAKYRDRYADPLRIEIVGGTYDAQHSAALRKRIAAHHLEDRVTMSGAATTEQVHAKLKTAKLYITVSLLETFGLTIFEAMSAGLPVIASHATCHPEVCDDAALFCDPHDPGDIAEKIHQLATDAALQQHYQTKGLERVKLFSWENSARGYLQEIEALALGRKEPSELL